MLIIKSLEQLGRYTLFMKRSFGLPDKWSVFGKRTVQEIVKLGVDSIPLVIVISLFIGAVITIQMQLNISSPLIPAYSVGLATRDIVLLEFSNSILCLILAGKVGSNIASEIGTMRVTEQIDALERRQFGQFPCAPQDCGLYRVHAGAGNLLYLSLIHI